MLFHMIFRSIPCKLDDLSFTAEEGGEVDMMIIKDVRHVTSSAIPNLSQRLSDPGESCGREIIVNDGYKIRSAQLANLGPDWPVV